jgi:LacI family transcriptional regulator
MEGRRTIAPRKQPHVALIIETSKHYGRELLLGIGDYIRAHDPWSIYIGERGHWDPAPPWLKDWDGDGIITRSVDFTLCRAAKARGISVVSLRHLLPKPDFPTLFPEQRLIGQRSAAHLIERGFRHFGYVGVDENKGWEITRRKFFVQALRDQGILQVDILLLAPGSPWELEQERLADWLRSLPKPVGIMASHDTQGIALLDACRRVMLRVPEEVAVVSVDNDPVLCTLANPPLSSLDQNVRDVGYQAALLLDRMMRGKKVEIKNYFLEPGHIVMRQSSDILAIPDEAVTRAVQYVRENSDRSISVHDLVSASGISRRSLELKFIEHFGATPLEEIHRRQLDRIRQLLIETDMPIAELARQTGFRYQEYFARFFKQHTGLTPTKFRRMNRDRKSDYSRSATGDPFPRHGDIFKDP